MCQSNLDDATKVKQPTTFFNSLQIDELNRRDQRSSEDTDALTSSLREAKSKVQDLSSRLASLESTNNALKVRTVWRGTKISCLGCHFVLNDALIFFWYLSSVSSKWVGIFAVYMYTYPGF